MKNITNGKFTCTCTKCGKDNVVMRISHVTTSKYGEPETLTKLKLCCTNNDCKAEWEELY